MVDHMIQLVGFSFPDSGLFVDESVACHTATAGITADQFTNLKSDCQPIKLKKNISGNVNRKILILFVFGIKSFCINNNTIPNFCVARWPNGASDEPP